MSDSCFNVDLAVARLSKLPAQQRPATAEKLSKWLLRTGCCSVRIASLVSPTAMANCMSELLRNEFPDLSTAVAAFANRCSDDDTKAIPLEKGTYVSIAAAHAVRRLRHVAEWFRKQPLKSQADWLDSQAVAVIRTDPSALVSLLMARGAVEQGVASCGSSTKLKYKEEVLEHIRQQAFPADGETRQNSPAGQDDSMRELCTSRISCTKAVIAFGHSELGKSLCTKLREMTHLRPQLQKYAMAAHIAEKSALACSVRLRIRSSGSLGHTAAFEFSVAGQSPVSEGAASNFQQMAAQEIQQQLSICQYRVDEIDTTDAVFSKRKSYQQLKNLEHVLRCGISVDHAAKALTITCAKDVVLPKSDVQETFVLLAGLKPAFSCAIKPEHAQHLNIKGAIDSGKGDQGPLSIKGKGPVIDEFAGTLNMFEDIDDTDKGKGKAGENIIYKGKGKGKGKGKVKAAGKVKGKDKAVLSDPATAAELGKGEGNVDDACAPALKNMPMLREFENKEGVRLQFSFEANRIQGWMSLGFLQSLVEVRGGEEFGCVTPAYGEEFGSMPVPSWLQYPSQPMSQLPSQEDAFHASCEEAFKPMSLEPNSRVKLQAGLASQLRQRLKIETMPSKLLAYLEDCFNQRSAYDESFRPASLRFGSCFDSRWRSASRDFSRSVSPRRCAPDRRRKRSRSLSRSRSLDSLDRSRRYRGGYRDAYPRKRSRSCSRRFRRANRGKRSRSMSRCRSVDKRHRHEEAESEIALNFEPGTLGVTITDGVVSDVKLESQAAKLGVRVGWRLLKVGESHFTSERLALAKSGHSSYCVVFLQASRRLSLGLPAEDLCLPIENLLYKITDDIQEPALIPQTLQKLKEEGIQLTSHLMELHTKEFDNLRLPLLLKSRLRSIWQRTPNPMVLPPVKRRQDLLDSESNKAQKTALEA